jgi:bacterioferritin-associated ferredoxin
MTKPGKPTLQEIQARLRVVCICKGIKLGRITDAIRAGASTVQQVNRATGSGSGQCGATRCGPVIEQLLKTGGQSVSLPQPQETALRDDDDYWFPTPVRKTSGGSS